MSQHVNLELTAGTTVGESVQGEFTEGQIAASAIAMYRMRRNTYMGDCIAVAYAANGREIVDNGLTNGTIGIYIKTPADNQEITSLDELGSGELFDEDRPVLLRPASACEFGIFGDTHCDCEPQRIAALRAIGEHGQGVYIQLPQEGLGRGLLYKARELELQVSGTTPGGEYVGQKDFFEAVAILGVHDPIDLRGVGIVGTILGRLGLGGYNYTLLSSNPDKVQELSDATGLSIVGNLAIQTEITEENMSVYLAKACAGMAVSDDELRRVHELLLNAQEIPGRSRSLIQKIAEDFAQGRRQSSSDTVLLEAIAATVHKF